MDPLEPHNRLPRCPECGYDLRGLPAEYACPECGFRFDAETVVFESKQQIHPWALALWVALTAWLGVGALVSLLLRDYANVTCNTIPLLLIVASYPWWRFRKPHYVILTREAIIYRARGRDELRVPWRLVRFAEPSALTDDIHLYGPDGARVASIPDITARDGRYAAQIMAAIHKRAQRYAEAHPDVPPQA